MDRKGNCPLTTRQIVDEYFIENRTRILDLAAFLDRLDRSQDQVPGAADFRIRALQRALQMLASDGPAKIDQIQLLLSDPTTEPKAKLDEKSASGAWNSAVINTETA
jgi:hypothetical protein